MFRKDPLFIPGWIYFFLMFPLASRLPESFGCENGIIENLQMFWLFGGLILCSAALDHRFQDWGGRPYTLWKAGILYYFPSHHERNQLGPHLLPHREWRLYFL